MHFDDRAWPDLVDGELRERDMPTLVHQSIEFNGVIALRRAGLLAVTELHLDMPDGLRVADVAAYREWPGDGYPDTPPFVTLEVVSPSSHWDEVIEKCQAYFEWGVEHVWLVRHAHRALYVFDRAGLHQVQVFEIPEFDLRITAADLLAGLPN